MEFREFDQSPNKARPIGTSGYPAELCNYLRKDPFDFIKQFVGLAGKEPRHCNDGRDSCRSAGRHQKTRIMRQQFDVRVD
jgi:hypothetical protein